MRSELIGEDAEPRRQDELRDEVGGHHQSQQEGAHLHAAVTGKLRGVVGEEPAGEAGAEAQGERAEQDSLDRTIRD